MEAGSPKRVCVGTDSGGGSLVRAAPRRGLVAVLCAWEMITEREKRPSTGAHFPSSRIPFSRPTGQPLAAFERVGARRWNGRPRGPFNALAAALELTSWCLSAGRCPRPRVTAADRTPDRRPPPGKRGRAQSIKGGSDFCGKTNRGSTLDRGESLHQYRRAMSKLDDCVSEITRLAKLRRVDAAVSEADNHLREIAHGGASFFVGEEREKLVVELRKKGPGTPEMDQIIAAIEKKK